MVICPLFVFCLFGGGGGGGGELIHLVNVRGVCGGGKEGGRLQVLMVEIQSEASIFS